MTWTRIEYGAWCRLQQLEDDAPACMALIVFQHCGRIRAYIRRRNRRRWPDAAELADALRRTQ